MKSVAGGNVARSLTRIANEPKPYVGRIAPIRRRNPRNNKTRLCGAGWLPGEPGNIEISAIRYSLKI
jgi:hypothetical protein